VTANGQTDTRSNKHAIPSVWFFIWRLIPYQPPLRLARSTLELLYKFETLVNMLLAKAFYDTLQGRPPVGTTLGGIVVLYVTLGLAFIGLHLLRVAAGVSLGLWVSGLLRRNLLACILARPGARALPGSVGEAISTLRDDVDELEGVDGLPLDLLIELAFYAGGLAILLWVDVQVTLLVFLPMLAVVALSQVGKWRLERLRTESREAAARFSGGLGEVLASVQAIQVAGAEERVIAHLRRLGRARQQATLRDWLQQGAWGALFQLADTIGVGLVLLVAAAKMASGAFTVGDLALYGVYLQDAVGEYLVYGGSTWLNVRLARVSVKRLMALLQGSGTPVPPERLVERHPLSSRQAPPGPVPPAHAPAVKRPADRLETLQVDRLTLRHGDSGAGIADVSFMLERGTLTAIVGRIGSGKTTLLRALLGLLPIDGGEVRWNGERVDDLAAFCVPPRVAYTPQVPVLLSDTLRENVLLGWPNEPERLARAVRCAVLERDVADFPQGLDTTIGVRGMRLSGGQVQRTAAARMFVREPELLVLDDISSALDVETEQILWQRMFEEGLQSTCLVVSHRQAVLERADQILVMENGRLTARGTLAELLETSEEMRLLCAKEAVKRNNIQVRRRTC
jgi:ATP-binding cassette subfamily B protein